MPRDIDIPLLEPFDPTTIQTSGDGISGADHKQLMANPIYSGLHAAYFTAYQEANKRTGELRHKCVDYEKRIRAYEENIQAMQRRIDAFERTVPHDE